MPPLDVSINEECNINLPYSLIVFSKARQLIKSNSVKKEVLILSKI